mgnify:FL=1
MYPAADELSNIAKLYNSHIHSGQHFIDPDFPPQSDNMLSKKWTSSEKRQYWRDIVFASAPQIFPRQKLQLFSEKIQPDNIIRGELSNISFLSSLAALAEYPFLLSRLFFVEDINQSGIYCVWLCDNGEWRPVVIDDSLPVRKQQGKLVPVFSHSNVPELWVSLIEKAYAKINGCYENIEGGFPEEALHDLTGAPYQLLWREQDLDTVREFIRSAFFQGYIVVGCAPEAETSQEILPSGLIPGYAFNILRTEEVQTANGAEFLLQLRNPWDRFEWNGDWGYDSSLWTEKLWKQLGVAKQKDGTFWVSLQEYIANFETTCVLKFNPKYDYYSVNFTHNYEKKYRILRLHVNNPGEITFSLNQRDSRYFSASETEYQYSCARILVARIEGKKGLSYVTGAHGQERNLQASAHLESGVYLVALEVHWNQTFFRAFTVSFYSEHSIGLDGVENADLDLVQRNIIKSVILTNPPDNQQSENYMKLQEPDAYRRVGYIHGLIYYYYENNSKQLTLISEAVEVTGKNLEICSPYSNDEGFEVTLPPGAEELVLYKIISTSWSWKTMYSFAATTVEENEIQQKSLKYVYFDSPSDSYRLQLNTNYNKYIKDGIKLEETKRINETFAEVAQSQTSISNKQPRVEAPVDLAEQYEARKRQLLAANEIFVDEEFPPDTTKTIMAPSENRTEWQSLKYKKLPALYGPKFQIIDSGVHPTSIQRGALGNNYFLSALALLAEDKALIERLFLEDKPNSAGIYAVWLCVHGEWKPVIIDDNIPARIVGGKAYSTFSYSKTGDAWVALLEKAYAKVYGNYRAIENGWPEDTLRDLTGAPCELLFREQDSENLWKRICEAKKKHFLIAGCSPADPENDSLLAPGFAFAILDAREVSSIREKEKILCIRNVWQPVEWEGDWATESSLWTSQLKKEVGPLFGDESCFWVSIQEYMNLFEATTILQYQPDYFYCSTEFSITENSTSVLRLQVSERSEITISLNQKDKRLYGTDEYEYSCGRLLVGRVGKKGLEFVYGAHGQDRNLQTSGWFEPGEYIITFEVHWLPYADRNVTVSFYSSSELEIEGVEKVDPLRIQKNMIRNMILESPPKVQEEDNYKQVQEPNARRIMGYAYGILYYFYVNYSTKGNKISETAYVTGKNLLICEPFDDNEKFEIELMPNDEILVIYKITSAAFSWSTKYSFIAQKVPEIDLERFQGHSHEYLYQDDVANNVYKLQINWDYNKYLRKHKSIQEAGLNKLDELEEVDRTESLGQLRNSTTQVGEEETIPELKLPLYQIRGSLEKNEKEIFGEISPIPRLENSSVEGFLQSQKNSLQSPKDSLHSPKSLHPSHKTLEPRKSAFYPDNTQPEVSGTQEVQESPTLGRIGSRPNSNQQEVRIPLPESKETKEGPVKAEPIVKHYPGMEKPPKNYPDIDLKYGKYDSKRIKYINFDKIDKNLDITCSDPGLVRVKTPQLHVQRYGSEYIRLKFKAPKQPGIYPVSVEIRANGSDIPEEILVFKINSL